MSSSAAGPLAHAIGSILADRYRLLRPLGSGGMGEVFLAEHIGLGHRVAVKILHESTGLPNATRRFLQEARQTARLEHPNIVDVVDLGETDDGRPFLVMEYLRGEDLGAVLEREGSLPWLAIREILIQLCEGLEAAHQAGLVHRDLKPENCFLVSGSGREDTVKILDFGIAKSFKEDKRRLTRSGGILGTPEYMSPEQARGRGVDPRSDVYAVGVLAYEMLCGTVPFSGDDYMGVLLQHIDDPIPPLPDAAASSEARAIVMRALSKDPGDRFESARAMAIALRASPEGGAVHSHPEIHDDTSWPESTPTTTIETNTMPSMVTQPRGQRNRPTRRVERDDGCANAEANSVRFVATYNSRRSPVSGLLRSEMNPSFSGTRPHTIGTVIAGDEGTSRCTRARRSNVAARSLARRRMR